MKKKVKLFHEKIENFISYHNNLIFINSYIIYFIFNTFITFNLFLTDLHCSMSIIHILLGIEYLTFLEFNHLLHKLGNLQVLSTNNNKSTIDFGQSIEREFLRLLIPPGLAT